MWLSDVIDSNIQTIIQTCGRCLRTAKGEREILAGDRTKKFGLCTFVYNIENDTIPDKLEEFFMRYYVQDNIYFQKNASMPIITNTMKIFGGTCAPKLKKKFKLSNIPFFIDIKNYINDKKEILLEAYGKANSIINNDAHIVKIFQKCDTHHFFDNREIVNMISELLNSK